MNGYASNVTKHFQTVKPNRVHHHDMIKNKPIFLDVSPSRSAHLRTPSAKSIEPIRDNFIAPSITRDVVYENMKPVFTLLRLMGAVPLTKPSAGVNQYHLASPAMLYSAVIFFSVVSYVLYLSLHKVQILRSAEGKFEEAVIEYLFTVYLFPLAVIPIMWYETRKIASVFNSWVDFEIEYKNLSEHSLPLKLYKKSLMIAIVIPLLSTTSVIITHATMVHFRPMQVIPYVFLEILTYILGGYWYLLCETLSICANVLAEDFQLALRNIGPAKRVSQYRGLWLRLSKLARDCGIAHCYTFTFVNLYLFLIITLSIYGLLSQISDGFGIKDIGLALTACCSVMLLFFICDKAHYASNNVRTNFQKRLLMVELSWMNSDAQTEVNMFLRATEMNPSQISLGGFFDVNRHLFKSLLATMVTYLVVLLQFQISIPDNDDLEPTRKEFLNDTSETDTTTSISTTTVAAILTTLAKKKKKN
ncbi:hypothetical protein O0L34_g3079 [Tuta absoluta]|nr:hypothetical protein O0L34_g3079 [Tuta absoluta]